jgi:hypothetical protein
MTVAYNHKEVCMKCERTKQCKSEFSLVIKMVVLNDRIVTRSVTKVAINTLTFFQDL